MHILIYKHKPLSIGLWHLEEIMFEWNMHRDKLYSARVGDDMNEVLIYSRSSTPLNTPRQSPLLVYHINMRHKKKVRWYALNATTDNNILNMSNTGQHDNGQK